MSLFKKAVKTESKLRLAVAGPAGSGKTYTALLLARELAGDKPVAVIDTERGSASKYADLFDFDVCELENFHPNNYVEAIRDAVAAGYGAVVLDSLSHAWNGTDGLLELVEKIAKRDHKNSFQAWGDVKPIENRLVEAITGSNIHVIATMRSKTEYVVEQNERGKATPRKVGTAPVQRDGFEYEFDVFGEMTPDNELIVQKTRCPAITGAVIDKPGKPLADTLRTWLTGAAPMPVEPRAPMPDDDARPKYEAPRRVMPRQEAEKEMKRRAQENDQWSEVRELSAQLCLSDDERKDLFSRHKKNRDKIVAELRERYARETDDGVTFEAEDNSNGHSLEGLPVHSA